MNFFESIIYGLSGEMTTPTNYGLFHIIAFLLVIGLTVFLCLKFKNCSDKAFRIILGIFWGIIVLLEIYKQIVFSFNYENGVVTWDYQWYAFPFQFCSSPLYILPFIIFLKDGKVRNACMSFMSTFAFFAGLVVMFYPNDVFIRTIGINIQTMVHHGSQVALGIFIFVHNRKKANWKYFLTGIIPYVALVLSALVLNVTFIYITTETFNMFYISPYFACTLPLLSMIYASVPYVVFLFVYIFGFVLAAAIMFAIMYGIYKLVLKVKQKKNA